ncbi:hypothetical protein E2562_031999 [Oryza meyeriana var. granulata]|uniref:Uncharacterized protein n=1 Tax=Oryza meyeriana var. granulata TaxID=110450 RepID=A0A6G1FEN9_9ORYZ|nr:hypothetical protein E2562_031999 [Oryza meyeriana var. granulata]
MLGEFSTRVGQPEKGVPADQGTRARGLIGGLQPAAGSAVSHLGPGGGGLRRSDFGSGYTGGGGPACRHRGPQS